MAYKNNPHKVKNEVKVLGKVGIDKLKTEVVNAAQDIWENFNDNNVNYNKSGAVLQKCQHITLKFTDCRKERHRIYYNPLWENWKPLVLPIMETVIKEYNYDSGFFPIIMLAKLPPKSPIIPHTDGKMDKYAPHKIHIPIATNSSTYFFVGENRWCFEEGTAYEVDNIAKHGAINNGETDRIHLIFEYMFGTEKGVAF